MELRGRRDGQQGTYSFCLLSMLIFSKAFFSLCPYVIIIHCNGDLAMGCKYIQIHCYDICYGSMAYTALLCIASPPPPLPRKTTNRGPRHR